MSDRIILDMNIAEALFVLDAVTKAGTDAHRVRRFLIATNAGADERAIVDLTAEILDRLELSLRRQMYPEIEESEAVDRGVDSYIENIEGDPNFNGAWSRW